LTAAEAHLAAIFRKLGVTNRTQAAMMAVQMGVGAAESGRRGTGQE
jgi:DNA-binding NarL/FixJ family response regulator